jgi:hypothetical protein
MASGDGRLRSHAETTVSEFVVVDDGGSVDRTSLARAGVAAAAAIEAAARNLKTERRIFHLVE